MQPPKTWRERFDEAWSDAGQAYPNRKERILSVVETTIAEERRSKDGAYHERDMLVAALSKLFPSYLARHDENDKEWEDEWRWIVYIELPMGQVSWHIHDDEQELFKHLEVKENKWDGHNTQRKYERLQALSALKELN